jgi:phage FluMu protein Com
MNLDQASIEALKKSGKMQQDFEIEVETPQTPQTPKPEQKQSPKPEIETPVETPETPEYYGEIDLGKRKIPYNLWTGKTKKKFKKSVSDIRNEEVDDTDIIIDTLLYDYIPDMYLTNQEQLYVLNKIFINSLTNEVELETECPECEEINITTVKLDEVEKFKPSEITENEYILNKNKYQINGEVIGFQFPKKRTESENLIKKVLSESDEYTSWEDVEIALIMTKDKTKDNIINTIDKLDNTPISVVNNLLEELNEKMPEFKMEMEHKCENCGAEGTFDIELFPIIFEHLG